MRMYIEKHRWIAVIMTLLIAIEIYYFSSISSFPGAPVEGINFSIIYHVIVFFLFAFFLLAAIKGSSKFKPKHLFLVIIISLFYAVSDELHQLFVPGRYSAAKDVLIDLMGILLAVLVYPKKEERETTKKKKSIKSKTI